MKQIKFIIPIFVILTIIVSCKKNLGEANSRQENKDEIQIPENFFAQAKVPGVINNSNNENNNITNAAAPAPGGFDLNNGEDEVILGNQLTNPYTVSNMQNAATIIYGGSAPTIVATHKYVRFKPSDADQFDELEDNQDLELQDYPMDYDVVQDGDYYQDPNLGTEEIGWLYGVVPVNYSPPVGIQYEVITTLHLTENAILEDMAESLASGLIYTYFKNSNGTVTITRNDNGSSITMRPPNPCDLLPIDDPNYCGSGGGGGGGGGTPPTVDGGIFAQEQTICGQPFRDVPLRQARVVAKRWFKIWRGYTDDNGDFTVTKRFKNKVKVIVKTKNNEAKVCKVRGIRLWQMLFPAKRRIGVFNNNELPNIRYVFNKPTDGNAHNKELTYWAAATTHNSVVEFRQYTTEFGLTQPLSKLKEMVTNWGFMRNAGAAPMWNKCHNNVIQTIWAATFIAGGSIGGTIVGGTIAVANTLKNRMDLIIGYTSDDYNCLLTSPQLKSTVYHELGHAQHYAQAGCSFWEQYRMAITVELSKLDQPDVQPYGTGNDGNTAPILATGEMWGNHCDKWYSERHYAGGTTPQNILSIIQGRLFVNAGSPTTTYNGLNTNRIAGLNANYAAAESYNPTNLNAIWRWIPEGLCYDLFDTRNDAGAPILDNATGFTINQCFNALQTDVQSIPAFRDRLLQQNGNLQQTQVTQLFQQYGY